MLMERYRELRGLNAHLLPEACNPRWHRPPKDHSPGDAGPAVLVLGSVYTSRFLLLRRLIAAGVEIELRGGHVSQVIPRDPGLETARRGECWCGTRRRGRSGARRWSSTT